MEGVEGVVAPDYKTMKGASHVYYCNNWIDRDHRYLIDDKDLYWLMLEYYYMGDNNWVG